VVSKPLACVNTELFDVVRHMDLLTLLIHSDVVTDLSDFFHDMLAPLPAVVADPSPLATPHLATELILRPPRCSVASEVDELRVLEVLDVIQLSITPAFSAELRARAAGLYSKLNW